MYMYVHVYTRICESAIKYEWTYLEVKFRTQCTVNTSSIVSSSVVSSY